MPRARDGRTFDHGIADVVTDASGNGSASVTFTEAFRRDPAVLVVGSLADSSGGAVFAQVGLTKSGMSITVTGSAEVSSTARVGWMAMEKG